MHLQREVGDQSCFSLTWGTRRPPGYARTGRAVPCCPTQLREAGHNLKMAFNSIFGCCRLPPGELQRVSSLCPVPKLETMLDLCPRGSEWARGRLEPRVWARPRTSVSIERGEQAALPTPAPGRERAAGAAGTRASAVGRLGRVCRVQYPQNPAGLGPRSPCQ